MAFQSNRTGASAPYLDRFDQYDEPKIRLYRQVPGATQISRGVACPGLFDSRRLNLLTR